MAMISKQKKKKTNITRESFQSTWKECQADRSDTNEFKD